MDDKNVGNWRFAEGTDAEVGGAWVQQHTRMIADGMKTIGIEPDDYFILPRHAWAGTWSHSAALWSGDIVSTFDELKMQVTTAQGTMMSGPVLWTTDIGGCKRLTSLTLSRLVCARPSPNRKVVALQTTAALRPTRSSKT